MAAAAAACRQLSTSSDPLLEHHLVYRLADVCRSKAGKAFAHQPILEDSDESDISMSSSEDDDGDEDIYFNVTVDSQTASAEPVEHDVIRSLCTELRKSMRLRPCVPNNVGGEAMSYADVSTGIQLPWYSCPYKDCSHHSNERAAFLHHVASGVSDRSHSDLFVAIECDGIPWMTRLDYVYGAIQIAERERWPL